MPPWHGVKFTNVPEKPPAVKSGTLPSVAESTPGPGVGFYSLTERIEGLRLQIARMYPRP